MTSRDYIAFTCAHALMHCYKYTAFSNSESNQSTEPDGASPGRAVSWR